MHYGNKGIWGQRRRVDYKGDNVCPGRSLSLMTSASLTTTQFQLIRLIDLFPHRTMLAGALCAFAYLFLQSFVVEEQWDPLDVLRLQPLSAETMETGRFRQQRGTGLRNVEAGIYSSCPVMIEPPRLQLYRSSFIPVLKYPDDRCFRTIFSGID